MRRLKDPRWFLIVMFLGIIVGVPLVQMGIEVRDGNGIQALQVFEQAPTAANLRNYERNMEGANWLARFTRPWMQFAQFQQLKDGGEKVAIGRQEWYFFKPGVKYMLAREESVKETNSTNDPIAAIVDFRDQLAARGIRLMVMPVPNKESIYPDRLTSRAESFRGVMAPRTENLFRKLRAANVEVIDLFKAFGEAREETVSSSADALYLAQDTHWSPSGVELAAAVVAGRLTELGWIQPGGVDYDERPAPVQRLGDLLRMLQVPMIERGTAPESVPGVQVVRRDNGERYSDSAEAEILVLGDSFLRIYQQDAPLSAGFIAHLAKELKQPLISLVNDGGGSTLVREELRARPAFLKDRKIVLWEFVERDIGLGIQGWKLVNLGTPIAANSPQPVN
jgi:hypothetical protein